MGAPYSTNETLTPREIEVLRLLARGCSYLVIAHELGISEHTVTTHIKNTYRKLDVHSARAAVYRALQMRFLADPYGAVQPL
ncbi:MAG TPA: LuxR C-terminal-related transcriptional regulator [Burkholderiales bacterium]|jgi:DNA-binding NarL/FixJ family response regulator|nr:LuxR C-terminal-related transcriptional regulator [Burkholderiales bacterium]